MAESAGGRLGGGFDFLIRIAENAPEVVSEQAQTIDISGQIGDRSMDLRSIGNTGGHGDLLVSLHQFSKLTAGGSCRSELVRVDLVASQLAERRSQRSDESGTIEHRFQVLEDTFSSKLMNRAGGDRNLPQTGVSRDACLTQGGKGEQIGQRIQTETPHAENRAVPSVGKTWLGPAA